MRDVGAPHEGARAIVVTSLEQTDPGQLLHRPAPAGARAVQIDADSGIDRADLSRRMYRDVGGPWHWVDRLDWSVEQWRTWTDRPEHHLWLAYLGADIAGYSELETQADGVVEVAYFGLLPGFAGRGLGGWFLTEILRQAWELDGTRRVWVHTCELDSPAAAANYRARGMTEFARGVEWRLAEPGTVLP